jgi:hypothetical protein
VLKRSRQQKATSREQAAKDLEVSAWFLSLAVTSLTLESNLFYGMAMVF